MKYYVYLYIRPDNGNVIYVGKGSGRRKYAHFHRQSNPHLTNIINLLKRNNQKPIIKTVYKTDIEQDAFGIEADLIKYYGRADIGKGTLCNFTDGGPLPTSSPAGRARQAKYMREQYPRTNEWKQKISKGQKEAESNVGIKNGICQPLMINYRIYSTVSEAAKNENISRSTLNKYLADFKKNGFPEGCKLLSKKEFLFLKQNYTINNDLPKLGEAYKKSSIIKGKENRKTKTSKRICVLGQIYLSVTEASKILNISYKKLTKKLRDSSNLDYIYLE